MTWRGHEEGNREGGTGWDAGNVLWGQGGQDSEMGGNRYEERLSGRS